MADYEALAPGGHAHLVSDIKSYADRAGGKGTTQLADGAVTRAKLASDVIARLEHMHDMGDTLKGNNFFGTLAEGTVLTADDVYGAPAASVEVYGVSTQVQATGKNLWNDARYASVGWTKSSDSLYHGYIKSFCDGILDLGNGDYPESTQVTICLNIVRTGTSGTIKLRFDYTDGTSDETSNISSSQLHYTYMSTAGKTVSAARITTTAGSSNANFWFSYIQVGVGVTPSAYEPYTGGKAAPSPDYPQEIKSVDDLALLLAGKNILDPSMIEQGTLIAGHNIASDYRCRTDARIPVVIGRSIVMSGTSSSGTLLYHVSFYKNGIFETSGVGWMAIGQAITVPSGVDECRFTFRNSDDSAIVPSDLTNMQLEYGSTATAYTPYIGQSVEIPLSDNTARSLPDNTRDQLTLSYIKKSTTPGYGVFSKVLTQRIDECDMGDLEWEYSTTYHMMHAEVDGMRTAESGTYTLYCTGYKDYSNASVGSLDTNMPDKSIAQCADYATLYVKDSDYTDAELFTTAVTGMKVQYALATPVTHALGTIELPVLPTPDLTAWCDGGSAQPSMSIGYEQDINIVIQGLEAAIADLATA